MTTYFYVRGPFMFYGSTPNYFNHGTSSYMLYIIYIFLMDDRLQTVFPMTSISSAKSNLKTQ